MQDFTRSSDDQQINPQRLAELKATAKERGEVYPYDNVDVYATQKAVDAVALKEITAVGQKLTAHSAVAEKLIAKGWVTKEAPKAEKEAAKK